MRIKINRLNLLLLISFSFINLTSRSEKKTCFNKFCNTPNHLTTVTAVNSSEWNLPSTWSTNRVPLLTDDVVIPKGINVKLSGSSTARTIMISGTLSPKILSSDFNISTKGIMVQNGGLLQIGTELNPYTGNGVITLLGSNPSEILMPNIKHMGSKFIGVMFGGRMELHGIVKKTWTQLNNTAQKGDQIITLKEIVNWKVNDEIVIASTDFDPHQAEKRTITAINGTEITLNAPLNYMHWGTKQVYNNGKRDIILDERAEVGLLSHNLKIQGDVSSESNGYGGHIMSMSGSIANASNIELYRMGQKSQLGKYPWHWHLVGNVNGKFIKNAGIHHSFNRIITIHATNNALIEGNVGYDFLGHGFFLEDGNETGNMFKNNLGILCKRPKEGEETTPHDIGKGAQNGASPEAFPATFWITNPNNNFIGNVSAGSDGSGFWHVILDKVLDESNTSYVPGKQPMGVFNDNKAHSNLFSWGIDGGIDRDTEEFVQGHYRPENSDKTQFIPKIYRFDGYKSVDRNVWIRADTMEFYDCDFGDNGRADFFSYNQILYNSLIVGKSANIGNPKTASEIEAGRTLPFPNKALTHFDNAFRGHSIYDGPSGIVNTHFAEFNLNGAKSYCFQINGASRKSTNHFARGITYDATVTENAKFDFDHTSYKSHMFLSGLIDEDGSLTGTSGTNVRPIIIKNPSTNNLYEEGANVQLTDIKRKPEWGAWLTQNKTYNYFHDKDYTNKSIFGAFTPRYFIVEYPDKTTHAVFNTQTQQKYFDVPVITNDLNYRYYQQYHKLPAYMSAQLNGCKTNSEAVIVAYTNLPGISYVKDAIRVNTMEELESSTSQSYLIKDNTIYIKFISSKFLSEITQRRLGRDFRFRNTAFICNLENCDETSERGNIIDEVTIIDYSTRSSDLSSVITNNDSRDSAVSTDGLTVPTFSYTDKKVTFNVENNGNSIDGYTDYIINLTTRQVWEYFNTLNIDYTGPDVELLIGSENGSNFSVGTYSSSDINKVRIGQDIQMDKFTKVKKLILRFHESRIGNLNIASTANVSINSISLGFDISSSYSVSSTPVAQDSDGDGIINSDEIMLCRDPNSASDFALEFNSDSSIFSGYTSDFINNISVKEGILKGTTTTNDPKIIKQNFVSFNGSDVPTLTFRFRANINNTKVELFWKTSKTGLWSASRRAFKNYTGNGEWQEVTLDFSTHSAWNNQVITSFRIDPTNDSNVTFEIDWIRANNAVSSDTNTNCNTASDKDFRLLDNILLYPNPAKNKSIIYLKNLPVSYSSIKINVFDVNGRQIHFEEGINSIMFSQKKSGIYFVKIKIDNQYSVVKKLVIN